MVRAVEAYRPYLLAQHFTLRTDHRALLALLSSQMKSQSRIGRWLFRLESYTFTIVHVPGENNVVADALSRIRWGEEEQPADPAADPYHRFRLALSGERPWEPAAILYGGSEDGDDDPSVSELDDSEAADESPPEEDGPGLEPIDPAAV